MFKSFVKAAPLENPVHILQTFNCTKISPTPLFPKPPQRLVEEKFIFLLKTACKTRTFFNQVHAQVIVNGFLQNGYVSPQLIAASGSIGLHCLAYKVFGGIQHPSVFDFNAMLRVYWRNGYHRDAILLFRQMNKIGVLPNCFTFPVLLKSCLESKWIVEGAELHCFMVKSGFLSNPFVCTGLIDLYSCMRMVKDAYKVFRQMLERNLVVWTSMISCYISCGEMDNARRLFDLAPERDTVMWNIVLSGYIEKNDIEMAREVFDKIPDKDVMAWNTMMSGYAKMGSVEELEKLFDATPERNVFTWNALISGYAYSSRYEEVLSSFQRMLSYGEGIPDDSTFATVLSVCGRSGALDLGKWIHLYSEGLGYKENIYVWNALIDMYAKCGRIDYAFSEFRKMVRKDLVTWNTMICGLATHGLCADALSLFSEMKAANEKPDGITFIGILSACSHMGLVKDGFFHFNSMVDDYSIVPGIEHYGCMLDLLGRAGHLSQAADFAMKMPIEADGVIWGSLLAACRVHKNAEIGEIALRKLARYEPENPANYVMLSNIYGDLGKWKDVARMKVAMRNTGSKKSPGYSLIEVDHHAVGFFSSDEKHPETEQIYLTLRVLKQVMRDQFDIDANSFEPEAFFN